MAAAHQVDDQVLQQEHATNTVTYRLYPQFPSSTNNKNVSDALKQYLHETIAKLAPHLTSYIWHYEPFTLKPVANSSGVPHLEGSLCFEDNVEDEWFVVWLLFTLTRSDKNLVVTVEDDDGQFLLIEAADYLPRNINPETSENRVYIYQGKTHFIPFKDGPFPKGTIPSTQEALAMVRSGKHKTVLSDDVQKMIMHRIDGYPAKIQEFLHRARCYIPIKVAALLNSEPSLVSLAVRAFYLRDPIDLKACRSMKNFPPDSRVWSKVTFTRCQYAQLTCQKFIPDRKLNWALPPANSPLYKGYDLGMKLASGFEILVCNAGKGKCGPGSIDDTDPKWVSFKASLNKHGYFEGLIENSQQYNTKLEEAKRYFIASLVQINDSNAPGYDKVTGRRVAEKISQLNMDPANFSNDWEALGPDDDDSWITLHFDEFEEMLNEKFLSKTRSKDIPKSLERFLEHESGLDGVEAPSSEASSNGPSKEFTSVRLNLNEMEEAMQSILSWKLPKNADLDSSSSCGMRTDSDEEDLDSDDDEILMADTSTEELAARQKKKDKNKKETEAQSFMNEMKKYMKQMDRELEGTNVARCVNVLGQVKHKSGPPPLAQFDDETDLNDSFECTGVGSKDEEFKPVNVDLSAIKNLVDCYESGEGPARNLFNAMGVAPSSGKTGCSK